MIICSEKIETTPQSPATYKIDFTPAFLIYESEIFDPIKNKAIANNYRGGLVNKLSFGKNVTIMIFDKVTARN